MPFDQPISTLRRNGTRSTAPLRIRSSDPTAKDRRTAVRRLRLHRVHRDDLARLKTMVRGIGGMGHRCRSGARGKWISHARRSAACSADCGSRIGAPARRSPDAPAAPQCRRRFTQRRQPGAAGGSATGQRPANRQPGGGDRARRVAAQPDALQRARPPFTVGTADINATLYDAAARRNAARGISLIYPRYITAISRRCSTTAMSCEMNG